MSADTGSSSFFTREDWRNLGQGNVSDDATVEQMLTEGYDAVGVEDD